MVLMDGQAVRACVTPVSKAAGHSITTLEGLGTPEKPHPIQAAFIAEQAAQCGYCINGMIISAKALLDRTPKPTPAQVKQGKMLLEEVKLDRSRVTSVDRSSYPVIRFPDVPPIEVTYPCALAQPFEQL